MNPLIATLKDDRAGAIVALGMIGTPAVEPLIVALKEDEDPVVRAMARIALGVIGKPAIEPLIATLKDEDPVVRREAAVALEIITGENFGEDPVKWQKWWEKNKETFLKEGEENTKKRSRHELLLERLR